MQLEINTEHKKADLGKKKIRKLLRKIVLGATIIATIYSGAGKTQAAELGNITQTVTSKQSDYDDDIVNIPEEYESDISFDVDKKEGEPITISDLQKIDRLFLSTENGSDLGWLQYCTNMKELTINFSTDNIPNLDVLKSLKNLEELTISCSLETYNDVSDKNFSVLHQCQNIKSIIIRGFGSIEPGFLESLTNLDKITFIGCVNPNLDYSKLTFLKELDLSCIDPYDLPIFFTNEEYNILKSNGVNVTSSDNNLERALEIGAELDRIVESLGITDNDTEKQKLDKILIYVLEKLEYDEAVSQATEGNKEYISLLQDFYTEGQLYGALEKDSAVCGNYSALVSALCKRVGIDTYYLHSNTHAWNLVEIDGASYYVDATWLDEQFELEENETIQYDEEGNEIGVYTSFDPIPAPELIKRGETDGIDWYLENPNGISEIDSSSSHDVLNFPSFIEIKEVSDSKTELEQMVEEYKQVIEECKQMIEENSKKDSVEKTEVEKIKNKKFEVKIDNKVFIISGAVLLGILGGLGIGIAIHNNNRKKRQRRISNPYGNSYGFNYDSNSSSYRRYR